MVKKKVKKLTHEPYDGLKTLLFAKGKTYAQAASILELTPASFSQKMNGHSDFKITDIELLANELEFDPSIIFTGEFRYETKKGA